MVLHVSRDEFIEDYWDYDPGEHTTILTATGGGKTHLKYQLLGQALKQNPELSYLGCCPKVSDATAMAGAERFGFQVHQDYPFRKRLFQQKPRGRVLLPRHIRGDEKANRERLTGIFQQALADAYYDGNVIVDCDDCHLMAGLLKLNPELEVYWTAGRDPGSGLWASSQKPSGTVSGGGMSTYAYSAPTHLFLGRDSDDRNLERFSEIGMGFDKSEIQYIVKNLQVEHINRSSVCEFLYLDRRGPYMCVVGIH